MACVELPAFPLQLLLKRHPDWVDRPVVVVDRDKPQGVIQWVNEHARAHRIRSGMRYSAGLSLARTLHAGEVPAAEIESSVARLVDRLRRFSPDVEPCLAARGESAALHRDRQAGCLAGRMQWDFHHGLLDEPGVFWLNASGLSHLYASPRRWANEISAALETEGFRAAITVGFTRFGTYAITKTVTAGEAVAVVRDASRERVLAGQVPLDRLGIAPTLRDSLQKLGVRTVQAFLHLPAAGIRRRFGPDAQRLHQLAAGDLWVPLQPLRVKDPFVQRHDLDDPETDLSRLLFFIKRLLNRLLISMTARHEALTELTLRLRLDRASIETEQIRPAEPTVDVGQIMNLVRLRLEALVLPAGVTEIRVTARAVRTTTAQHGLFVEQPRRDLAAANRALARIRAEFGDRAVVRARVTEGHLPEARFAWEPVDALARPEPREVACRPMVRRMHARPIPLPPRPRHEPDGWLVRGGVTGHVMNLAGPYLVSGGWWRSAVHREYYFAEMRDGDVLWIYYDRPRRRWCWQGQVE